MIVSGTLYPFCVCVFGMFVVMYGRMLFSRVFAIIERSDMGLYEVLLSMTLLGLGMGTMLANLHMCGIMLVLCKRSFQHTHEKCESKRAYVF